MNITITKKQFEAIYFGINQIQGDIEAASDEDYIKDANEALEQLFEIVEKYKVARVKAIELNKARRYIRSQNGGLPQAKVDKMARLLLNKIKKSHEAAIY